MAKEKPPAEATKPASTPAGTPTDGGSSPGREGGDFEIVYPSQDDLVEEAKKDPARLVEENGTGRRYLLVGPTYDVFLRQPDGRCEPAVPQHVPPVVKARIARLSSVVTTDEPTG